jgi:cephalosporin hydroxylase
MVLGEMMKETIDNFNVLFYAEAAKTWKATRWMGRSVYQNPCDLWIFQEIIVEKKPDFIIECGTLFGGNTLYLASICDLVGKGTVFTIDIKPQRHPVTHKRIINIAGSSENPEIVNGIKEKVGDGTVMAILDSAHWKRHVRKELRAYSDIVTVGQYMIVSDTNINGHPITEVMYEGPWEAVQEFLASDDRYVIDKEKEKFMLTFNPDGYLLRVK